MKTCMKCFIVYFIHRQKNDLVENTAVWVIEAPNCYLAYREVFTEIATEEFLKYLRTPEGALEIYNYSFFEIVDDSRKIIYDFSGNLLEIQDQNSPVFHGTMGMSMSAF